MVYKQFTQDGRFRCNAIVGRSIGSQCRCAAVGLRWTSSERAYCSKHIKLDAHSRGNAKRAAQSAAERRENDELGYEYLQSLCVASDK